MADLNASVRHLVDSFYEMAPELAERAFPDEKKSNCAKCPLAAEGTFLHDVRCCTYEPSVPNFLVGRAIRRGGVGARQIMARLRRAEGRSDWGVQPARAWVATYEREREHSFGRRREWACPYWVEGPLGCSIWHDRNGVCRTWHCRHDDGARGHRLWTSVRQLLHHLENLLAARCMETLPAPLETDDAMVWAGYYVRCVEWVDATDHEADDEAERLRSIIRSALDELQAPIPEVLAPEVKEVRPAGESVELVGYSPWNPIRVPRNVFVLLAKMDGQTPHAEALETARAEDPTVEPSWVEALFRAGVLRGHDDPDAEWGFEGPDLDPESLAREVARLRGR